MDHDVQDTGHVGRPASVGRAAHRLQPHGSPGRAQHHRALKTARCWWPLRSRPNPWRRPLPDYEALGVRHAQGQRLFHISVDAQRQRLGRDLRMSAGRTGDGDHVQSVQKGVGIECSPHAQPVWRERLPALGPRRARPPTSRQTMRVFVGVVAAEHPGADTPALNSVIPRPSSCCVAAESVWTQPRTQDRRDHEFSRIVAAFFALRGFPARAPIG